jgi:hypothetical protein
MPGMNSGIDVGDPTVVAAPKARLLDQGADRVRGDQDGGADLGEPGQ